MHGGYARPPCWVTLTGSFARTFHTRFLSPARGLEVSRAGCRAGVILPQPSHGGAAAA